MGIATQVFFIVGEFALVAATAALRTWRGQVRRGGGMCHVLEERGGLLSYCAVGAWDCERLAVPTAVPCRAHFNASARACCCCAQAS